MRIARTGLTIMAVGLTLLASSACTHTTIVQGGSPEAGSPACQIQGTYQVTTVSTQSNTCTDYGPGSNAPATLQFLDDGAGGLVFVPPGHTSSCEVKPNGCKLDAACAADVKTGGTLTMQMSWTFDAQGFTGLTTFTLPALTDNSGKRHTACSTTETDQGVRQ
jgi:hypothetical protein